MVHISAKELSRRHIWGSRLEILRDHRLGLPFTKIWMHIDNSPLPVAKYWISRVIAIERPKLINFLCNEGRHYLVRYLLLIGGSPIEPYVSWEVVPPVCAAIDLMTLKELICAGVSIPDMRTLRQSLKHPLTSEMEEVLKYVRVSSSVLGTYLIERGSYNLTIIKCLLRYTHPNGEFISKWHFRTRNVFVAFMRSIDLDNRSQNLDQVLDLVIPRVDWDLLTKEEIEIVAPQLTKVKYLLNENSQKCIIDSGRFYLTGN